VPRLLSTLLVIALLGGTAAAFAVTQGLKIEPSPILAPRIDKVFSPVCDCSTRVAAIRFTLRKPDRVRLEIVEDGDVVRTLVAGKRLRRGKVTYTWNGRDDQGRFVSQGVYRPRVHLEDQHRTIDLPNEMRVDTTAPTIALVSVKPRALSPDGDGRGDRVAISYRTNEPAHAILLVDGTRVVFTRRQLERSSIEWNGRVGGRVLPVGTHRLRLAAEDRAGNVGAAGKPFDVVVRYVALARDRIQAKAGTRFGVRLSADAPVRWRLGARSGTAKPGLLVLRAPAAPGRYTLTVSIGAHQARAALIVRPRP
jgi:FlgD Ig-like domain